MNFNPSLSCQGFFSPRVFWVLRVFRQGDHEFIFLDPSLRPVSGFLTHAGYIEPEVPTSAAVFTGTSRTVRGEGWDANPLTNVSFVQIFLGLSRDTVQWDTLILEVERWFKLQQYNHATSSVFLALVPSWLLVKTKCSKTDEADSVEFDKSQSVLTRDCQQTPANTTSMLSAWFGFHGSLMYNRDLTSYKTHESLRRVLSMCFKLGSSSPRHVPSGKAGDRPRFGQVQGSIWTSW